MADKIELKKDEKTIEEYKPLFKISFPEDLPKLPDLKDPTIIDVRYTVVIPFVQIHVYWDNAAHELRYDAEEPQLTEKEKQDLALIEEGLNELINISYVNMTSEQKIIEFLEKNVRVLITEFSLKISNDSFINMMYYIYRDFIGMGLVEPLMRDPMIEDIECNGFNTPIYLVHRKYRNIRTNILFPTMKGLTSFVEKLAQKCGQYVSYANPLLDGSLPTGDRVNATYTEDVTSRGPTFTLRKFTKEPWTPIKLMDFKTVSPEILAYIWMLVENKANMLIIGGTGSGKTSFLNAVGFFMPPAARVVSIEDSVTGDSKIIIKENERIREITIKEFVDNKIDAQVMTLDEKGKIIFIKPSNYIKHNVKKEIYEVLTRTGRRIKVTKDHSLFSLGENGLIEVKPGELKEKKSFIAVPRILPISCNEISEINLMNHLGIFNEDFLCGEPIAKMLKNLDYIKLNVKKERFKWWKNHNLIKIEEFIKLGINFSDEELCNLRIKSKNTSSIPVIFKITPEFLEFCGLWLGDGSYDNFNANSVIISNVDEECRKNLREIAAYLGSNYSLMDDGGVSQRIHSTVFYKFMKQVLKFDGYSNSKKIPDFIFGLSNDQIKNFIRGYFSADGCIKKNEVSCASQSEELLQTLQTLLLRFGIISRINDFERKDKCINLSISSLENIEKFKEIGFMQKRKNDSLNKYEKKSWHTFSDVIPLNTDQIIELSKISSAKLSYPYFHEMQNIGREYVQQIAPTGSKFNDLSHNDIFWDKVKSIKKISENEIEVFDLSIPKYEKFICNNIFVHNTRELNLYHENWLPAVSRQGVGATTMTGERHGEVSLFDLLKESLRQRPDYIIVGEIRGKEAYVLFQAMASGHSSYGTMHAESVQTVIRRLQTPPISLSAALIENLDAVAFITPAMINGKESRRLKEINEIIRVPETGVAVVNTPFVWNPATDTFMFKTNSKIFEKIIKRTGVSWDDLLAEFKIRTKLMMELYKRKIFGFKEVAEIIQEYYKTPETVMQRFGLQK